TSSEGNVKRVSKPQKRAARVILDATDELNLRKSSLIFRRIKDEKSYPSCITKLLTKNSD
ncbi:unnamed protein product, partial [Pocillopora meandrina]